ANWRQFAAATATPLLRALLGPVLDRLWKHQEEDNLHSPHQTTASKHPVGQKMGRGYCHDPHHTCSVAHKICLLGPPHYQHLPTRLRKTEGTFGKL
ncbi:hypothetical protein N336_04921, partial [Phalacrocorax carbo]